MKKRVNDTMSMKKSMWKSMANDNVSIVKAIYQWKPSIKAIMWKKWKYTISVVIMSISNAMYLMKIFNNINVKICERKYNQWKHQANLVWKVMTIDVVMAKPNQCG